MRIQELVGTSVASGIAKHLKQMVMQPTKVQYQADTKTYEIRTDDFLMNLIQQRRQMQETGGVHPVSMLGLYASPFKIGKLFKNEEFMEIIRTFDGDAPKGPDNPDGAPPHSGGYYQSPPRKPRLGGLLGYERQDPAKGYVLLNRAFYGINNEFVTAETLGHEYMHRGLAMASWNKRIKQYINAVSPMVVKPPYNAWGATDTKDDQFIKSKNAGHRQLATQEHMMMYAFENRNDLYIEGGKDLGRHKMVPGFEKFETWAEVRPFARGLLNSIGRGVEQYMIKTAQEINNIPEEQLGEMIYFWAKKRGIK